MRNTLVLGVLMCLLGSCLKREQFPNRPDLNFIGVYLNPTATGAADSLGFVRLGFTDGDGDLGLDQGDTLGQFALGQPYFYNLFIHYFERQNGTYVEVEPALPFHVRFKDLTPEGGDKTLEGEMDVGIYARPGSPFDTVRYEMYMVDRALQHSDTIVTPDIVLPF